jgi:hypothetical protein
VLPSDEAIDGMSIDAGIAGRVVLVWCRPGEGPVPRERGDLRLMEFDDFSTLPPDLW